MKCFSIPIEDRYADEIISEISKSQNNLPYWIVTLNPEMLLAGKRDTQYAETLRKADLRIVDSFGLKLFGFLHGKNLKRLTGVDLAEALIHWAHQTHQSIAFIGGEKPKTAARAYATMAQKYPGLKGYAEDGGMVDAMGNGDSGNEEALLRLTMEEPDIILVAFGHPKQERWIERVRSQFPKAKAIVGIGGTFDYWGSIVKRAPKWVRTLGLEWLYRLIQEPKRWRRILDAVIVFPFYAILDRFSRKSHTS